MPTRTKQRKSLALVAICLASALSILSFCGRYFPYGSIARNISNFFVGSFGMSFFGIMIAVIAGCIFYLVGKRIVLPTKYIVNFVSMYLVIVIIVHTCSSFMLFDTSMISSFGEYIAYCYNYYAMPTFGGVVWGSVAYALQSAITIWGALLLMLAMLAINIFVSVNFFYDLASHKIILDRGIVENIEQELEHLNNDVAPNVTVDNVLSAQQVARQTLFEDNNASSNTQPPVYNHAQTSTIHEMLSTIDRMKNEDNNTAPDSTASIWSVPNNARPISTVLENFEEIDNDSFIVPSTSEGNIDNVMDVTSIEYHENDATITDIVVAEPTIAPSPIDVKLYDQQISNDKDISRIQDIDTTDTQQDIYDNTYVANDNHVVVEVAQPVQGGLQMQLDIEERDKYNEQSASIHQYARYERPPVDLLDDVVITQDNDSEYRAQAALAIKKKLSAFNILVEPTEPIVGPTVTQYRFEVKSEKTRMNDFQNYADDLKSCLATTEAVSIEAPIPGTSYVGIEVANKNVNMVKLRSMLEDDSFDNRNAKLNFAIGQSISGKYVFGDMAELVHLLVAGTTGSGKSVVLNNIIISMMYKYSPEYVRFILIDPKLVEFAKYNGSPHLLTGKVITNSMDALSSMDYLINEMEARYQLFLENKVRNVAEYNMKINPKTTQKIPYLVLVVDELADLMSVSKKVAEEKIVRLAQKSRAAGIHLILATQRPSVDVISGVIKGNLPARIALQVSSAVDSRTIIDLGGAEKLLGKGDMLFQSGAGKKIRLQAPYISGEEIDRVIKYSMSQNEAYFPEDASKQIFEPNSTESIDAIGSTVEPPEDAIDPLCKTALHYWLTKNNGIASISSIQRALKVGFNRAGTIQELLVDMGYLEDISSSESNSTKRRVLVTIDQLDELFPTQTLYPPR